MSLDKYMDMITAYIDGEMSPAEKVAFEELLLENPELQKKVNEHSEIKELMGEARMLTPSQSMVDDVMRKVNKGGARTGTPLWRYGSMAAAIAVLLWFASGVGVQPDSTTASTGSLNPVASFTSAFQNHDLTDEDVFNFAINRQIPLQEEGSIIEILNAPNGEALVKLHPYSNKGSAQELMKFKELLSLYNVSEDQLEAIFEKYKPELKKSCVYHSNNQIALNTDLWQLNQALMADLLSLTNHIESGRIQGLLTSMAEPMGWSPRAEFVRSATRPQFIVIRLDSLTCNPIQLSVAEMKGAKGYSVQLAVKKEFKTKDIDTMVQMKLQCQACPVPKVIRDSGFLIVQSAGIDHNEQMRAMMDFTQAMYAEMEQLKELTMIDTDDMRGRVYAIQIERRSSPGHGVQQKVVVHSKRGTQVKTMNVSDPHQPSHQPMQWRIKNPTQTQQNFRYSTDPFEELNYEIEIIDSMMKLDQKGSTNSTLQLQNEMLMKEMLRLKKEIDSMKKKLDESNKGKNLEDSSPAKLVND